ncbi:hypothetical protein FIBSPDRAFT_138724 [Athelia psychrophila]|uniref:Uncharacterized protein n=1 Tax=Athelia psychrophila TaxID=1759441 RepID=A0A166BYY8_9AGAM|nr:hypothetical protein FIBSPDRAFT_138724 [Fibularhizoctonia sp. CBS 109695]
MLGAGVNTIALLPTPPPGAAQPRRRSAGVRTMTCYRSCVHSCWISCSAGMSTLLFRTSCHPLGQPLVHLHDSDVCPRHEDLDPQCWLSAAGHEGLSVWPQRRISLRRHRGRRTGRHSFSLLFFSC